MDSHRRTPLAAALVALGGITAGHELAYRLAFPDAAQRAERLSSTGHAAFHVIAATLVALAVLALASMGAHGARTGARPRFASMVPILALIQIAGFTILELAERHGSIGATLGDRAVLIGIGLQVAVALVVALLITSVTSVAIAVAAARSESRPRMRVEPLRDPSDPFVEPRGPEAAGLRRRHRAPPLPLAA